MFRYVCIIFRESYHSTLLMLQKPLRLQTQQNQYIQMYTYVIVTVDDKIQSKQFCELCQLL